MILNKKAFSLVEILVGIVIVSIALISGFQAFAKLSIGKIALIEKANIQKDSYYFSEKLFQIVKSGGTIDYEEYFNRKLVGTGSSNGHYSTDTGYGNYGEGGSLNTTTYGAGYYYCRSGNGVGNKMTGNGCYDNSLNDTTTDYTTLTNPYQRYGQYSYQFIDYNSNYDSDLGDEDGDGNIIGDDDDEFLGEGPIVFDNGANVRELYLLSGDKTKKTLIRWDITTDSYAPSTEFCTVSTTASGVNISGDACLGTIEFLQLEGKDWGLDHDDGSNDADGTQFDGVIDTWLIASNFSGESNVDLSNSVVAGTTSTDYREELFSESINVTDFQVYLFPNIDTQRAWKDSNTTSLVAPYVTFNYKIKPSWKTRSVLNTGLDEIPLSTTVSLTDIFSN